MGFSAGAELSAPAAVFFEDFEKKNNDPTDPLSGISARPDFVGIIYPGPTPFARGGNPPIPRNVPPAFITCAGSGDRGHAIWANEYFLAMLQAGVPNIEIHIYGNGFHPGSGSTGGITDRKNTPFGTWHHRFVDWFRDLGSRNRVSKPKPPRMSPHTSANLPAAPDAVRILPGPRFPQAPHLPHPPTRIEHSVRAFQESASLTPLGVLGDLSGSNPPFPHSVIWSLPMNLHFTAPGAPVSDPARRATLPSFLAVHGP